VRCRQLDTAKRTRAAGLTTKPGPDAKPRNRANRCCRQRAYQVCLAESRVRRLRVASIVSFPPSTVPIYKLMQEYRKISNSIFIYYYETNR
jgi:hypothetical protein